nr:VWA domain-containing protein [uncultured Roseateles sp.]
MFEALHALLPLHWLRPWALWLLLAAPVLLIWGRRPQGRAVPAGVIDAHLLPHLLVRSGRPGWLRPADTLSLALACFSLALAGPAWQREAAPFAIEEAPLMIALDLSDAMDATDLPPSRLDRARDKLRRLIEQRGDAPTGLIVYAGSAHLVLPPTQDRAVLNTYLDALSTPLMPTPGNASAEALAVALDWAARSPSAGTVLALTADWPAAELARTESLLKDSPHKLIVWALGTAEGGPLRDGAGRLRTDAQGRARSAHLDVAGLQTLRDRTGAAVLVVTADDQDIARVQALIKSQHAAAAEQDPTRRWRDQGPIFIWAGLLALLASFRRGWVLHGQAASFVWAVLTVLAAGLPMMATPSPAAAQQTEKLAQQLQFQTRSMAALPQGFVDWWLTPDQQGRWWLEHGQPARAAQHFKDPFWRGLAHARAGAWQEAADAFARVDSAAAWFNQAQMLARLGRYPDALAAYDQALIRQPGWPQALADRERVKGLIPPDAAKEDEDGSEAQPGEREGSEPGQKQKRKPGPPRRLTEAEVNSLWLKRLDTSPAGFLARKFELQLQTSSPPKAANPTSQGVTEP